MPKEFVDQMLGNIGVKRCAENNEQLPDPCILFLQVFQAQM